MNLTIIVWSVNNSRRRWSEFRGRTSENRDSKFDSKDFRISVFIFFIATSNREYQIENNLRHLLTIGLLYILLQFHNHLLNLAGELKW